MTMQTDWQGYYLDGRTAARRQAAIHLTPDGLRVTTDNGAVLWWPYDEVRQTQGFYAGEQVRLERGKESPEILVIADTAFLSALRQVAPQRVRRFHDPARRQIRAKLTVAAAVIVISITTVLYVWGIPALVALAVPHMPVAWEEQLGEMVIAHLAPPEKRCTDPTQTRIIDDIMKTVTTPLAQSPYTFRVIVVDNPTVNALAAPGGYILLFRGLLEHTRSAEELAGVLAHEVQHVLQRHATRALLQHASTGLLATVLIGDVSGILTFGLEAARVLTLLQYSRRNEEEADREGIQLLFAADIDSQGMLAFFETLEEKGEKQGKEAPAILGYLSTHPSTKERIERLKSISAQSQRQPVKLLQGYPWRDIRKICQANDRSG
ncbi:MAG: M48 family metallopeptidase [Candidatus Binatia bacterium]